MNPDKEQQLVSHWLKEDTEAIELINQYFIVSQIWDDLHDKDKAVSNGKLDYMMQLALVEIPRNKFFQQHYLELMPIVQHCLMTWMDSNNLEESGDDTDLKVSYVLRSVTTDLLIHMAGIIGGSFWRSKAALSIRKEIYHDNEPFEQYRDEILSKRKAEEKTTAEEQ